MKNNIHPKFDRVQDVPGYTFLARNGHVDVINYMHKNLHDVDLCLQAAKHKTTDTMIYDKHGDLESAAGWHVTQVLGKGKDGVTFLGYRYNDTDRANKTVKCLSKYAKQYLNHTVLFNNIYSTLKTKNSTIIGLKIRDNYTYYNASKPMEEVNGKDFNNALSTLCRMNSWSIKNTGFAFWDFGFSSGKNYMFENKNTKLRWIDYGGSGMVRCPSFDSIYEKNTSLQEIELLSPFGSKGSLVVADSEFLMCQFLLHIEYWLNLGSTNADLWSSMLQVRRSVIKEFIIMLPNLLSTELAQGVYNKFKERDWTDQIVWKQIGKYINENT